MRLGLTDGLRLPRRPRLGQHCADPARPVLVAAAADEAAQHMLRYADALGEPGVQADSMEEDQQHKPSAAALSRALVQAAAACEGFSGRSLRKLPFLAHAMSESLPTPCSCLQFIAALRAAASRESEDRTELTSM